MSTNSSTEVRQAAELTILHARVEALEGALREVEDWLGYVKNDGMQYAVRESNALKAWKIARAALENKDSK